MSGQPPGAPDPWRSFRGVMAGTLVLELIVLLLALPVVSVSRGGLTLYTGGFIVGFAVVLLLLTGLQGRPWAIWANVGVQVLLAAGYFIDGAIGFVGLVFLVVWALIVYLRYEVKRRQDRGLLPGQRDVDD
jgi:Protein of unknown function (DUF4233)